MENIDRFELNPKIEKQQRVPGFYLRGTRPVRWKRSRKWQARLWLGRHNGGDVSLGLLNSEMEAHRHYSDMLKRISTRIARTKEPALLACWECLCEISEQRGKTYRGLPKWVYCMTQADGSQIFSAVATIGGRNYSAGDHLDPKSAFLDLWRKIETVQNEKKADKVLEKKLKRTQPLQSLQTCTNHACT